MTMKHVATIAAYPAKDGTFSIAFRTEASGDIVRKTGIDSLSSARYEAQKMAWDTIGECVYAPLKRRGEYRANVWVHT
jgi:hypothetical protein